MTYITLLTAIDSYQNQLTNRVEKSNFVSSIIRYTLPGLGFKLSKASDKRLSPRDKSFALEFAESINLNSLDSSKLLEAQEIVMKLHNISLYNVRHQRKTLKKFIEFIATNYNFNLQQECKPILNPIKTKKRVQDREIIQNFKPKRIQKKSIRLSLDANDYIGDKNKNSELINQLETELSAFERYMMREKRQISCVAHIDNILRLFGWKFLYGEKLENLSIKKLIKLFDLNPDYQSFDNLTDYYIYKGKIDLQAKEEAKKIVRFLDEFFIDYGVSHSRTKEIYVTSVIEAAKYIYVDTTDKLTARNYEDVPLVKSLKIYRTSIKKSPKTIKPELPQWSVIVDCLKEMKRRCDITHYEYTREGRNVLSYYEVNYSARAKKLQDFLILGFFVLIPPPRARVVRELELGKTLKYGLFTEGVFIPAKDLKEDSPKYYIHLRPEDYKTGDLYGEWVGEFPNVVFSDGTCFYDYLNKWLYDGYRDFLLQENKHNIIFLNTKHGKPYSFSTFSKRVECIFKSTINQNMGPHILRTIFRTHLVNQKASVEELESAAYWMKHSTKIAVKNYTQQSVEEKLTPASEVIAKINSELLKR